MNSNSIQVNSNLFQEIYNILKVYYNLFHIAKKPPYGSYVPIS